MKKTTLLPTLAALALASCSGPIESSLSSSSFPSSEEESTPSSSESEVENEIQLFDDPHFETGLVLKSTSTSDAHVVRDLNYEGKAEIIGAFMDSDKDAVLAVAKEHGLTPKVLYNAGGAAQVMEVTGLPHAVLFDKKHRAVKVWEGFSPTLAQEFNDVQSISENAARIIVLE